MMTDCANVESLATPYETNQGCCTRKSLAAQSADRAPEKQAITLIAKNCCCSKYLTVATECYF